MDQTLAYTAKNRRGWDQISGARPARPATFFAAGGSTLDDHEVELVGPVVGLRLLHLACANGNDTLSWAGLGAEVTGVDISAVGIAAAQASAAATGGPARFLVADLYELPPDLGQFDVVYLSYGVVCWLPDLVRWAAILRGLVRPGGRLALFEHHPIWETVGVRSGRFAAYADYFGRGQDRGGPADDSKRPVGWTPDTPFTSFVWPVSDVVSAVLGAGFQLEVFREYPQPAMYRALPADEATRLPAVYAIIARA